MTTSPEASRTAAAAHAGTTGAHDGGAPLAISHAEMNAAYEARHAVPLSASMTWLTRYRDSWWVVYERGWLRVTDTATADDLDQAAARLAKAEGT